MYNIQFYENPNGKSNMRDFLRLLYERQEDGFYKLAAFLDYLAENGSAGDQAVCRYSKDTIYMHCIPDFKKEPSGKGTGACVILYGQCHEATFVILHHYITKKIPTRVPLLQMYQAVRELQAHSRLFS